jgi:hypothetical protein
MPLPVEDSMSSIFAPTESRLRQLNQEKHRLEEELTVEQEKGWKNLLRSYDQMSDGSSLRTKPFRPSGSGSGFIGKSFPNPVTLLTSALGPSSEHSSRSHSTRQQGRSMAAHATTPPPPLSDIFHSRGIDLKTFLMKLDHAVGSSDSRSDEDQQDQHQHQQGRQEEWQEEPQKPKEEEEEAKQTKAARSESDDVAESLPFASVPLFQSLLKRATVSAPSLASPPPAPAATAPATASVETTAPSLPAPAAVIGEREGSLKESRPPLKEPPTPSDAIPEVTRQPKVSNAQRPLPSSTLSPISTENDDSSILFPDLSSGGGGGRGDEENDLFEFSFEDPRGLGKILSAARNQHTIGERPLNLQKRLRQKNHTTSLPPEPGPQAGPKRSPSPPLAPASEDFLPTVRMERSRESPPLSKRSTGDLSPLQREPSSYSFSSPEEKKPLLERRDSPSSPEPPPDLDPLPHLDLPISRINSSFDSQDSPEEDPTPAPPHPASSPFTAGSSPPPEESSPKRIPIFRKQLSRSPNDMRTQLVRGFEVVKVPHPPLRSSSLTPSPTSAAWCQWISQAEAGGVRPLKQ